MTELVFRQSTKLLLKYIWIMFHCKLFDMKDTPKIVFWTEYSKIKLLTEGTFCRGIKWYSCHLLSPRKEGEREKMLAVFIGFFWWGFAWKWLTHLFICVCCFDCWSVFSFGHGYSALKFSILDSKCMWWENSLEVKTVLSYSVASFSWF